MGPDLNKNFYSSHATMSKSLPIDLKNLQVLFYLVMYKLWAHLSLFPILVLRPLLTWFNKFYYIYFLVQFGKIQSLQYLWRHSQLLRTVLKILSSIFLLNLESRRSLYLECPYQKHGPCPNFCNFYSVSNQTEIGLYLQLFGLLLLLCTYLLYPQK